MIDYLKKINKNIKLLPSNIGLSDPSIATSVSAYNSLVIDRNRLLKNSSLENPVIQNLDSQLFELQKGLISSLQI